MAITEKYVSVAGGGAHDGTSEANAYTWAEMITAINAAAGNSFRYNVKVGTYSRTTNIDTISVAATSTNPIIIRGYSSTIGDGDLGRTNGNGAIITTNLPAITYTTGYLVFSGGFILAELLNITSAEITSGKGSVVLSGAANTLAKCVVANTGNNSLSRAVFLTTNSLLFDCDISCNGHASSKGIDAGTSSRILNCRILGTLAGINASAKTGLVVSGCAIYGSATGIDSTATGNALIVIAGNTIVGATTGISMADGVALVYLLDNLITDNTTGLNCGGSTSQLVLQGNRFDRNTTNIANGGDWVTATSYGHNTTSATQANEYENYASNDFRLKSGSPARGNGLPAYRDIGALQHQDGPLNFGTIVARRDSW